MSSLNAEWWCFLYFLWFCLLVLLLVGIVKFPTVIVNLSSSFRFPFIYFASRQSLLYNSFRLFLGDELSLPPTATVSCHSAAFLGAQRILVCHFVRMTLATLTEAHQLLGHTMSREHHWHRNSHFLMLRCKFLSVDWKITLTRCFVTKNGWGGGGCGGSVATKCQQRGRGTCTLGLCATMEREYSWKGKEVRTTELYCINRVLPVGFSSSAACRAQELP